MLETRVTETELEPSGEYAILVVAMNNGREKNSTLVLWKSMPSLSGVRLSSLEKGRIFRD
jgi:hypothetical protein